MSVAVVVATYNRADTLVRLLAALDRQEGAGDFEVVVADDGSSDDTVLRVRALAATLRLRLRVLPHGRNTGPAAARNRGWRATSATSIAFTDDDCVPEPQWLARLVGGLSDADIAIGRTRPPADQLSHIGPFSSYLDMGHNETFSTCNVAYRRTALAAVDGFDEVAFGVRLLNGEDADLGLRCRATGCTETFVADAVVHHDVRPSDFVAHLRAMRNLEGLIALVERHPSSRRDTLNAGWFLRSVDKAVLLCWAAGVSVAVQPRRWTTRSAAAAALGVYAWQFGRSHYPARSRGEWLRSLPLGLVADSWAVVVLARGSLRRRTLLL